MSVDRAVKWMLDVIITQNKRKLGVFGKGALGMYYLLPKTSESIVNFSYQTVYEQPPENYISAKVRARACANEDKEDKNEDHVSTRRQPES